MDTVKRSGLMAVQAAVAVCVLGVVIATLGNAAFANCVRAEVVRGVEGGLLVAAVEVLVKLSRPAAARRSAAWQWRYGAAVAWRAVRGALVGGFLLGLILALGL